MAYFKLAALFLCIVAFTSALPTHDEARGNSVQTEHDLLDAVYNDCLKKDSISCFKYKVFNFVDKMLGNRDTITVMDGVQFVKTPGGEQDGAPRAISSDDTIESVLFNRVTSFLGSHTLKIDLKGSEVVNAVQSTARSLNEYAESLEEEENLIEGASESRKKKGGGKKGKGQIGALIGLVALKAAILGKLALAAIALIAGKALIIGKIALVLSAIIGLKKLLANSGGNGKHVTYEVVPHASHSSSHIATHETAYAGSGHGGGYGGDVGGGYSGGSGGWGRSLDAQSLAYRGHPQVQKA
ncbi:uncharacterized protein LOC130891312 [Diorhabda carinulata]|uniref:uncharacterized protein LOC130891312 n=1 Tax=Diorhabda carinulata TaxID=1163345 RepID=UPI0025A185D3|nr:uncharacterized protein LOC130891312 [Diorhabda carinulata]